MQPEEQEAEDTKQESQEKQDEVIDIDSVNTIPKTIEKRGGIFERVTLKMNQFFEERFRNHKINKESQGLKLN